MKWNQCCPLLLQISVCYYSSVREGAVCKGVWESCELCFERILAASMYTDMLLRGTSLPSFSPPHFLYTPQSAWKALAWLKCLILLRVFFKRNFLSHWETLSFTFTEWASLPQLSLYSGVRKKGKKSLKSYGSDVKKFTEGFRFQCKHRTTAVNCSYLQKQKSIDRFSTVETIPTGTCRDRDRITTGSRSPRSWTVAILLRQDRDCLASITLGTMWVTFVISGLYFSP